MKVLAFALGGAVLLGPVISVGVSQASTSATQTVFVSPAGNSSAADNSCQTAAFRSINAAITAVTSGGTVVVCNGTYHEDVAVTKTLTLEGQQNTTVDATNLINGIDVTAANSTVTGFTVQNAIGEGILVNNVNNVTVENNVVVNNNTGVRLVNPVPTSYPPCASIPLPGGGALPGDCGEGIHIMGSSGDKVLNNISNGNAGGILLSDETGPTSHNLVSGNTITNNAVACGITLAGHNPMAAANGVPAPAVAGVFDNTISSNNDSGNGLHGGGGAGILMATGLANGAVYNNTVQGNNISGNGHSGVTVHDHAGGFVNGNVITGNEIDTNNLLGDSNTAPVPIADPDTTGVLVSSTTPLSIQISGNTISDNHFGIFTAGPVTAAGQNSNTFISDSIAVSNN